MGKNVGYYDENGSLRKDMEAYSRKSIAHWIEAPLQPADEQFQKDVNSAWTEVAAQIKDLLNSISDEDKCKKGWTTYQNDKGHFKGCFYDGVSGQGSLELGQSGVNKFKGPFVGNKIQGHSIFETERFKFYGTFENDKPHGLCTIKDMKNTNANKQRDDQYVEVFVVAKSEKPVSVPQQAAPTYADVAKKQVSNSEPEKKYTTLSRQRNQRNFIAKDKHPAVEKKE